MIRLWFLILKFQTSLSVKEKLQKICSRISARNREFFNAEKNFRNLFDKYMGEIRYY